MRLRWVSSSPVSQQSIRSPLSQLSDRKPSRSQLPAATHQGSPSTVVPPPLLGVVMVPTPRRQVLAASWEMLVVA
ncbi:hypothetical protein P3339_08205 [Microbulbifer sp. MLAF003]|uniref:hypothetical protein n=1 Tax=unclassified Microbulbifer TaxID=2619833 RepID=UPI0024ACEA5A|nr:hypothetical protein [Microbulbifer sp. MLAF003]WHI52731.1 hypothetical protein P3339_08205 [Microbulbifer sp. MLAF003]